MLSDMSDTSHRGAHTRAASRLPSDCEFFAALAAATLPGIEAIARELAKDRAAAGSASSRSGDICWRCGPDECLIEAGVALDEQGVDR